VIIDGYFHMYKIKEEAITEEGRTINVEEEEFISGR